MVVAPQYAGPLGIEALNKALREAALGPSDEPWLPKELVIQTATYRFVEDDTNIVLANGTFGKVVSVGVADLEVEYEGGLRRTWDKAACVGRGSAIYPAYALSVHRAQGGQARRVVVVVGPDSSRWTDRAMGYTSVSRAQEEVVIVGDLEVLRGDPLGGGVEGRQTMLLEHYSRARARSAA